MIDSSVAEPTLPSRVGHDAITRKTGRGRDGRCLRGAGRAAGAHRRPEDDVGVGATRRREPLLARGAGRGSVDHPNICQIYEIGEDDGELFIAMELLEGETLAERLRRGPLSSPRTIPIGLGILAALGALHRAGSFTATSSRRTCSSPPAG